MITSKELQALVDAARARGEAEVTTTIPDGSVVTIIFRQVPEAKKIIKTQRKENN